MSKFKIVKYGLLAIMGIAHADDDLSAFGIPPGALPVASLAGAPILDNVQRVYWDNRAIPITLQVGIERQIRFPASVRLGIPGKISDRLRTQSVDGTVHWLAYEPFEVSRVQVRELQSGRTYLLDVRAVSDGGDVIPLAIVDRAQAEQDAGISPDNPSQQEDITFVEPSDDASISDGQTTQAGAMPTYDYVTLTRFAVQQLYAPERLLKRLSLPGVSRVPVQRKPLPLYRGGALRAEPYVSWTDGQFYITAVKLSNITAQPVLIDPRHLRGRWLARTLLTAQVQPYDDSLGRDHSFVFLLSPVPFAEATR